MPEVLGIRFGMRQWETGDLTLDFLTSTFASARTVNTTSAGVSALMRSLPIAVRWVLRERKSSTWARCEIRCRIRPGCMLDAIVFIASHARLTWAAGGFYSQFKQKYGLPSASAAGAIVKVQARKNLLRQACRRDNNRIVTRAGARSSECAPSKIPSGPLGCGGCAK